MISHMYFFHGSERRKGTEGQIQNVRYFSQNDSVKTHNVSCYISIPWKVTDLFPETHKAGQARTSQMSYQTSIFCFRLQGGWQENLFLSFKKESQNVSNIL